MAQDTATDFELLEAWRGGDREAGSVLIGRHFATVRRYLRAHGAGPHLDDLTQATFEACVAGQHRLQSAGKFRAYLLVIARRQLIALWRHREEPGDALSYSQVVLQDHRTSPTQAVARQDRQRLLAAAMVDLPDEFRETLELFYWADLSLVEIADELGVAVGTVKSRLHRGRVLMTRALQRMKVDAHLRATAIDELARSEPRGTA